MGADRDERHTWGFADFDNSRYSSGTGREFRCDVNRAAIRAAKILSHVRIHANSLPGGDVPLDFLAASSGRACHSPSPNQLGFFVWGRSPTGVIHRGK